MKRHVQEPGIRKWSGNDLLDLQHEPLKAIEGFITNYAPCILSGCRITAAAEEGQYDVSPGLLSLRGKDTLGNDTQKIVPFAGATAVALPLYLTIAVEIEQRPYVTNGVQPVACDYKATASAIQPIEGEYFAFDAESPTFADVIQDAGHRFVSDEWLARLQAKFDELLALLLAKLAEVEGKIIDFEVGELRYFATGIQFNDPKYLPADGSAIFPADYPNLTITMTPQVSPEGAPINGYWSLGTGTSAPCLSAVGNGYTVVMTNTNIIAKSSAGQWVIGEDLYLDPHDVAFGKWGFMACGWKWDHIEGSPSYAETDGIFRIYTSVDGLTWQEVTRYTLPSGNASIVFDGQDYVIRYSCLNNTQIFRSGASADAWTTVPVTSYNDNQKFVFGSGILVHAYTESYKQDVVRISKNRGPWQRITAPEVQGGFGLRFVNGKFYINKANRLLSTEDFETYTTVYEDVRAMNVYDIAFVAGIYYILYNNGDGLSFPNRLLMNASFGWVNISTMLAPLSGLTTLGNDFYRLTYASTADGYNTTFNKFTGAAYLPNHNVTDSGLVPYIKVLK